jgi:hypothetical protein
LKYTKRITAALLLAISGAHAAETPTITYSTRNDTSRPMRDIIAEMGAASTAPPLAPQVIGNIFPKPDGKTPPPWTVDLHEPLNSHYQTEPSGLVTPPTLQSFVGLGIGDGGGSIPPDTNGDASPAHYIQWINTRWAVFNKTTGTRISGPTAGNSFWAGFGGACQTANAGDPLAIWDDTAQRWVMSQFVTTAPFKQCVAVSTTSDPLGSYHRYEFVLPVFGDYPHIGVWTDTQGSQNAYLLVTHDFNLATSTFLGASYMAMERDKMLAGQPAALVRFSGLMGSYGAEPIHLDGPIKARAGSCPTFIHFDTIDSSYLFWDMCLNWAAPLTSTLSATPERVSAESSFRGNFTAVPQLGSAVPLDSFGTHIMYRATARTFPEGAPFVTSLAINHTVLGPQEQGGIKWVHFDLAPPPPPGSGELLVDGFEDSIVPPVVPAPMTKKIIDQGTFVPDTMTRFMGGIAMDKSGNLGVGYSRSSATTNPTIMLSSRQLEDPAGTLRDETACTPATTGSQTGAFDGRGRWGDYASMSVDPVDDCTFWFTSEYYPVTSNSTYATRICSFKLDGCGVPSFAIVKDSPARIEMCAATETDDPSWNIRAGVLDGFAGNVAFSAAGNPGGSTASFVPASVTAPGSSLFTLVGGRLLPSGEYGFDVVGTSGALTRSTPVSFGLSSALAAAPTQTSPANAAIDVSQRPILVWAASTGALSYLVEIASDAGFTTIVASATVTDTQLASPVTLTANTQFFWRVRANNYCGVGAFSSVRSFTTGTAGQCPAGQTAVAMLDDNVEAGINGWTTSGTGGTAWSRQTALAGTGMSTMVWRVPNNTVTSDRSLTSPAIVIPAAATSLTLSYDTHHNFEIDGPGGCWDAGALEISVDGGTTFTYMPDSRMFTDPYDGLISDGAPLAGREAWCHLLPGLSIRNIVDLTGFDGQTVQLRFRTTSDSNTAATAPNGWSIDNIKVERCEAN